MERLASQRVVGGALSLSTGRLLRLQGSGVAVAVSVLCFFPILSVRDLLWLVMRSRRSFVSWLHFAFLLPPRTLYASPMQYHEHSCSIVCPSELRVVLVRLSMVGSFVQ